MILVRHAMPAIVRGVPPADWHLGDVGRAAARGLAARLQPGLDIVASDEPKAIETAEELGGAITLDARLREATRPAAWDDGYRETARRYVSGERLEGWELQEAVVARVTAAVEGAELVVTHGLAMALYVRGGVPFWEELAFPDAWRYSALAGELRRVH